MKLHPNPLVVAVLVEAFPYLARVKWDLVGVVEVRPGSVEDLDAVHTCSYHYVELSGNLGRPVKRFYDCYWFEIPGWSSSPSWTRKLGKLDIEWYGQSTIGKAVVAGKIRPEVVIECRSGEPMLRMTVLCFHGFDWASYEKGQVELTVEQMTEKFREASNHLCQRLQDAGQKFLQKPTTTCR